MSLSPIVAPDIHGAPEMLLIQLCDPRDGDMRRGVFDHLRALVPNAGFALATLSVDDWNADLSPWPAPPVFGDEPFGGGARETLDRLLSEALPALRSSVGGTLPVCLGGYSLAGLFALWASYECDAFDAVAAASPSVWFDGWDEYAQARRPRYKAQYLSLGKKEPRTRNRRMATVGEAVERQHARCAALGIPSTLEWNEGNHFVDPELRTAKGFAWVLDRLNDH